MTDFKLSGGGGGGGSVTRTPDNLRSADTVEVLLGLGEGEFEGLENGFKSFYIGDTQLQNNNGSDNFSDYQLEILPGSGVGEEVQFNLGGAARSTSVNVTLAQDTPVVRQLSTGDVDFLEVRLVTQALYYQADDGVYESSIVLNIEYKGISDTEWKKVYPDNLTINGKTTSTYAKDVRWAVPRIDEPYEIRITKVSQDSDTKITSVISWESIQEIDAKIKSFPNTALAHLTIKSSDQFTSVPEFSGIYKCLKIKIPSNYDPINHTYDGAWDGTFKIAWSDNPAWCLYDFIMNNRYGVRAYSDVTLDKWDTYEAAQWCDEMVSDGRGGKQPRYTFNAVISDACNGKEQAAYMAGLFNAVLVEEATGYLRLKLDKDDKAIFLFSPENVVEGNFSYTFTDPATRYNDVTVAFTNPELNWETDRRRIYNTDDIAKNGRVTYEFAAVGCIREGEALRRAYYQLLTSLSERVTVSFQTNRIAQMLSNYDVVLIADPNMGYSITGRIKYIDPENRKKVHLRDSIYLEAGINYKVVFTVPEGIFETEIESISGNGNLYDLIFKEELPDIIPEKSVFSIYGTERTGTPKPFRILSIVEEGGESDAYTITAIEVNRVKWEAIDNLKMAFDQEYSGLPSAIDIPYALDVAFSEFYDAKKVQMQLMISTILDYNAYPYYSDEIVVYSREVGTEAWTKRDVVKKNLIIDHPAGKYEFVVLPKSILGNTPPFDGAPRYVYEVTNLKDPPSDVRNLRATKYLNGVQLEWDPNTDIDLAGYEIREGDSWDTAKVISENYQGNSIYIGIDDSVSHTYLVKAIDGLGNRSVNAASTVVKVTPPDNVREFYATTNIDRIRFDWTEVEGIDIVYVIKKGDTWESGIEIMRTKGNNATVLQPAQPGTYFSIKALSPAGLYSEKARFAKPDVELAQNRNIILEVDNGKDGFPGITYNFEPSLDLDEVMVMNDTAIFAEHYFPVTLDKVVRARNWFETQAFVFGSRLTWEDLHYRYSEPKAHITWINSSELSEKTGEIKTVIAVKDGDNYDGLIGFPLESNTDDVTGKIHADMATGVRFMPGRLTNGLYLDNDTEVQWRSLDIPEIFSMSFRLRVTEDTKSNFEILRMVNSLTNSYLYLYVNENQLFITSSDRVTMSIPVKWVSKLDFITIAISQDETTRKLFFSSDYANYTEERSAEIPPLGKFNSLYI